MRKLSTRRIPGRNELFEGLSQMQTDSCMKLARSRVVEQGGFFFYEGESCDSVYLLTEGRARLYQVSPGGRQALLHFVSPSEALGYWALLPIPQYAASAQAIERCEVLFWDQKSFLKLMEKYSRIAINVMRMFARDFDELRERYVYLATQPVQQRVAWALLKLEPLRGNQTSLVFPKGFNFKDVADMAGTTIYTVSRVLNDWKCRGLVTKQLREYIAHDREKVIEIARPLD